jgi:hypothetical protein
VSLPTAKEINLFNIQVCPNCKAAWLSLPGNSIVVELTEHVLAIQKMAELLTKWDESLVQSHDPGFELTIEIAAEGLLGKQG